MAICFGEEGYRMDDAQIQSLLLRAVDDLQETTRISRGNHVSAG